MKRLSAEQLSRALKERDEARAFQAATNEILTAISRSASDAKPVFEAIVDCVRRLFGTQYAAVFLVKGEELHLAAAKTNAKFAREKAGVFRRFRESFPQRIDWDGFTGKALRSGKVAQMAPIIGNPKATRQAVKLAKQLGYDAMLLAPLMREGKAIGAIGTTRPEAKPFATRELALFKAFAAQAVIAIENARLFNETKEALEQQTATAEILKVISSSPTATQPVFESIVQKCHALFEGSRVGLWQVSDGRLFPRASTGYVPEPMPIDRESAMGACVLETRTIHLPDLRAGAEQYPRIKNLGLKHGYLSGIYAPLLREGRAIGGISVLRLKAGAFSDKEVGLLTTFADQAVIAIENARLFNETKEALERQTATAEILKVISRTPTDVQPVFEAIVRNAVTLCEAKFANAFRYDGEMLHFLATTHTGEKYLRDLKTAYPMRPDRSQISGRAILSKSVEHMEDALADPEYESSHAVTGGWRKMLGVPLLRDGNPIGAIAVGWQRPGQIPHVQEELLKTFADQAVIAIENARLFNETKEALERQTATAEILKVIAGSPSNAQPVFDAIASSALRLFDGLHGMVVLVRDDKIALASHVGPPALIVKLGASMPMPLDRESLSGRVILDRKAIGIGDVEASGLPEFARTLSRSVGMRALLGAPMLREGKAIGAIVLARETPGEFNPKQVALLETFADQAVIAIENARLFNETREALERQTAISEVLRVISSSPADVQPVLAAVAARAAKICDAKDARIFLAEGDHYRYAAGFGEVGVVAEIIPLNRDTPSGRAMIDRAPQHIHDIAARSDFSLGRELAGRTGWRTILSVPLLREDRALGTIVLRRKEVRPFNEKQIALLETFADQAAIAIENARLFNETREALEQQTATSEILRVISSSPADIQPVFDSVIEHAMRLCDANLGTVGLYDGKNYRHVAQRGSSPEYVKFLFSEAFAPDPTYTLGRMIAEQSPVHLADYRELPAYRRGDPRAVATVELGGARTFLAVPMIKEGRVIGGITLRRPEVRPFTQKQIDLVSTFANQAVIAIENTRLFNETKEALERQTATSELLKVIGQATSDLQPVFDTLAENAVKVCRAGQAFIFRFDGQFLRVVASCNVSPELRRFFADNPVAPGRGTVAGRTAAEGRTIHVHDVRADPQYGWTAHRVDPIRTVLTVPMIRGGEVLGVIGVNRPEVRPFSEHEIELLQSFASQAVIAIENVRLFNETREALEHQTATAEVLQVISGSVADARPVFTKILQSCRTLFASGEVGLALLGDDDMMHLHLIPEDPERPVEEWRRRFRQAVEAAHPRPARDSIFDYAMQKGQVLYYADVANGADVPRGLRESVELVGTNYSSLFSPLLWEGRGIGALNVFRVPPAPFSEKEIRLLKTFADQAVIAIQNARLFNETREALERQTATSEILRVISGSPTDTRPVFDVIAKSAMRLFGGLNVAILLRREKEFVLAGYSGPGMEDLPEQIRTAPLDPEKNFPSRAILEGRVLNVTDWEGAGVPEHEKLVARSFGIKSGLMVPLLRQGEGIGAIAVVRATEGAFIDKDIALLQSFADQAVIAIENVRLFNETKEALERQTATSEILKVIAASPADVQPVFRAILENATRLCGAHLGFLSLYDGEKWQTVAHLGANPEFAEWIVGRGRFTPSPGSGLDQMLAVRVPVHIADYRETSSYRERYPMSIKLVEMGGVRSYLAVPMLKDGRIVGGISVYRAEVRTFEQKQIDLLSTFADQAVIAIDNVRLFNETKEALERQTATAEILASISGSMTDTQPVFDAIVRNLKRLFGTRFAVLQLLRGGKIEMPAVAGDPGFEKIGESYPRPLDEQTAGGLAMLSTQVLQFTPVVGNPLVPAATQTWAREFGFDSVLFAPMVREGKVIGALGTAHRDGVAFDDKQVTLIRTFADQAVIAIENVRLFNETKEALEHQTATAEVLQVISGSVADPKPVFTKILQSCKTLFASGEVGLALLGDDGMMHLHLIPEDPERPVEEWRRRFRRAVEAAHPRPARDSASGYAMQKGQVLYYADVANGADVPEGMRKTVELVGANYSVVFAPLLWEGRGIGALNVVRAPPAPFSEKEIRLLKTFADQAVIAIQNARLFNETKEALEKQTATANILQVLSGSPSDTQPVFEAIVRHAARLCESTYANVFRYDGEQIHLAASEGGSVEALAALRASYPSKPNRLRVVGRVIETMHPVHVEDTLADADYDQGFAGKLRLRRLLGVPLLRGDRPLGAITVGWADPGPIQPRHEDLLKTFADQAVIAIENVRLFNETKEALERQTATAEILKVISASTTDVQPVFEAIAQTAHRLFDRSAALQIVRDGALHVGAIAGFSAEGLQTVVSLYPMELNASGRSLRAMREGKVLETTDVRAPGTPSSIVAIARAAGFRSIVTVPLLRADELLGQLSLTADEVRPRLDDKQRDLLKTFADQAVIAIENVRLFKELQARTEALTKSVGQLTALGEVGRAISSTLELDEVLRTIVQRAVQLTGVDGGSIYEFDQRDGRFHLRAAENIAAGLLDVYRAEPIRLGEGAVGRAGATREPVVVEDVLDQSYKSRVRELLIKSGARALLAVPLLAEDRLLGALAVSRKSPGPFAPEVIDLLKTFATQSAVAIQNARLFLEIEEKSRELEEASRHKSHFLASMSHELRTPLNAILGFNEMILGQVYGEVPADMKEPLEDIQKSGKHLLRLINNVLDLAKIEAGRMELALADYSVQDTVESVRATLRPLAEAKGLELVASVPQDIPLAYGDGGRITQCLMNLAGNSLKFTKEGRVEIAVEAENGLLKWRVSDTGIGIPPDKIPTLFSEFRQTDATIASEYGGTGLGLSITRKFVEMHGGRIWVESELGKGSTFTVEIPLRVKAPA